MAEYEEVVSASRRAYRYFSVRDKASIYARLAIFKGAE
jgi:hypothetical protein